MKTSVKLAKHLFDATVGRMDDLSRIGRISTTLTRLTHAVDGRARQLRAAKAELPELYSFDRTERLRVSVLRRETPWRHVNAPENGIPRMITQEERRYYAYMGPFYSARGEVVELGPWLGSSTSFIVQGLTRNPRFAGKRLHVFDDFVWRPRWMNNFVSDAEKLENHQDFRFLFEKYARPFAEHLQVEKRKFVSYDGNEDVPQLVWNGLPIEMIFVDCGRLYHTNDAWYRIFSPAFIPGVTLIVMQDWRLQFQVPISWENQTQNFTDSKGAALQLIHELMDGTVATFLYRGGSEQ